MKVGIRTPSPEKMVKARTTGRVKRAVKRSYNPVYGKKGIGYLKDPERAVKNKVYHKLTVDPLDPVKNAHYEDADLEYEPVSLKKRPKYPKLLTFFSILGAVSMLVFGYKLLVNSQLHVIWLALTLIGYIGTFILIGKYETDEEKKI